MSNANYEISKEVIMQENPLYLYRVPLSILITIGVCYGLGGKFIKHDFLSNVVFPLVVFLLSLVVLEAISKSMISENMVAEHAKEMDDTEEEFFSGINLGLFGERVKTNVEDVEQKIGHEIGKAFGPQQTNAGNGKNSLTNVKALDPTLINHQQSTMKQLGTEQDYKCLMGPDVYPMGICSGNSPQGRVAPVPGPQWQVQSASAVAERLRTKNYVPSKAVIH